MCIDCSLECLVNVVHSVDLQHTRKHKQVMMFYNLKLTNLMCLKCHNVMQEYCF